LALQEYDYVLITYGTLVTEFPRPEKKKKTKRQAENNESEEEDEPAKPNRGYGIIARMEWYRICLDEGGSIVSWYQERVQDLFVSLAHIIRNRRTQAANCVFELEAVYRWSLSGTLIINGVEDVYPLLRFGGISSCADWELFRDRVSRHPGGGNSSLINIPPTPDRQGQQEIARSCCEAVTGNPQVDITQ
jgi:SNF2 family DNA or RNA helicase